jgi:putative membrane protein
MKHLLILSGAALALAACGQPPADQAAREPAPAPPAAPMQPAAATPGEFVQTVANSDAFEIQSGRLAEQRAARDDVKAYGRMMVTAHQATTRDLSGVAPQVQLSAPTPQLDATQQADLDKLKGLTGTAFDDAYLDQQTAAHERAVRAYETFVNEAADTPLRQWASRTLPTIRDHLARAEALENAT